MAESLRGAMTGPTFSIKLGEETFDISEDYLNTVKTLLVVLERTSEVDLG